jgi:phospholipid N-methyltransferase
MIGSKPVEFIKGTLRNPSKVGSIIPSSRHLAREFTRGVEVSDDAVVLELGPGTGPITEHLYEEMEAPQLYVGIERDSEYVDVLHRRFPEMTFVEGSAADMVEHVDSAGFEGVDAIISALPFSTLPQHVMAQIYDGLEALMEPGTTFRTVQYAHAFPMTSAERFRRRMNRLFGQHTRSRLVWRNIPPGYILSWEG